MNGSEGASNGGEGQAGSFISRFVWTFVSPKQLYEDIAAGAHWWQPWVWVSLISMVVAYISIPIQMQLTRLNPNGQPQEQIDQAVEAMEKFGFLGVISTPVMLLIVGLIVGGISYVLVNLLAEESSFKKYFSLMFYANIVVAVGQLIGILVTRMKGVEAIRSIHDAAASFGPAMLVDPDQKVLYPVLASLDVFYIWYYALMVAGLIRIFRMSTANAVLAVIPVWLLQVLFALISARFSGS
jgi:hypothetical protein